MSDLDEGRQHAVISRRELAAWSALWLAIAALVVLPYLHSYRHLSPFDELVHVDYVVKAQHLELVNGGEKIGQVAMREQACRGHDIESISFPSCRTATFDPNQFPENGFNTAYPDPPLYYAVTAAGAAVVDLVPGIDSVVTAARGIGVLWLAGGLALTFLLARRLGATTWAAAGATFVLASAPTVAHATATVTSDAPALLVGALLCLVALGVVEGRVRWWWLVPAAALAGFVKATSLTVMGVVVVYLLLQLVSARRDEDDGVVEPSGTASFGRNRVLLAAGSVVAGGVLSLASWTVLTSLTALPAADTIPMRQSFEVSGLNWSAHIAPNILALVTPLQIGYLPPFMQDYTLALLMAVVNTLLVVAVAGAAWAGPRGSQSTKLAVATLAGMVVSGPALVLLVYVGSHTYIPIPPRYGLSIVPAAFAVVAVVASKRRAGGPLLTALGAAGLLALLVQTW